MASETTDEDHLSDAPLMLEEPARRRANFFTSLPDLCAKLVSHCWDGLSNGCCGCCNELENVFHEIDFEQGDIELLHWCDGPSPLTLGSHAAPTACTAAAVDRILWPFTISSPTRNAMHCVRRRTAS